MYICTCYILKHKTQQAQRSVARPDEKSSLAYRKKNKKKTVIQGHGGARNQSIQLACVVSKY